MARMNEITVYNIVLESIGQRPISGNILNIADRWVSQVSTVVNNAKRELLINGGYGWTFCTETINLIPDATNNNYLPTGSYLNVKLESPMIERSFNGSMYVYDTNTNSFKTETLIAIPVIRDLDWIDIPDEAKLVIAYTAAVNFIVGMKGSVPEANFYAGRLQESLQKLESIYSTNRDAGLGTGFNTLNSSFNR